MNELHGFTFGRKSVRSLVEHLYDDITQSRQLRSIKEKIIFVAIPFDTIDRFERQMKLAINLKK
jgi:hypothetical protein